MKLRNDDARTSKHTCCLCGRGGPLNVSRHRLTASLSSPVDCESFRCNFEAELGRV